MGINGISADYYPTGYVDKKKTAEMPNGAEKTVYSKELSEVEESVNNDSEFSLVLGTVFIKRQMEAKKRNKKNFWRNIWKRGHR